ncbi:carbohydrate-binding protein [Marinoscillum furvescens]|uniref:Putative secreted protein (Por secretion system target) n=1 Tax=Marinoscillum furvescens DSM 4134 TaxID=1122208 RepID=A0A3D9L3J5_MARFU|nr:carbohydrate-binding protein [Marinoscillum furvescens]RED99813.1 putative secreted protein (Por secretion system target) [Marinoscillum furvescens DSM 4134]
MPKLVVKKSNFQIVPVAIVLALLLLTMQPVSGQYLKASGQKIVNADGEEVIWRGIGLGGWMLQEGYMLRTSGAQYEIEDRIEALIGNQKKEQFYAAWLANHMRKIDVDSMASWGYNMIRLPMHYKLYTPPIEEEPVPGSITWLEQGFEMTDALLEWCKANNMYLILDLHAAPGGQGENKDISDYDPSKPSLWESTANQDKMVALWRKLAERYADEPMLAAYDIINEPNWGFQDHENDPNGCAESQNTLLWNLQKRVTKAIREVDQNHIIVIEGNCWGNNYGGLHTLWDDNLVISYHKYWNPNTQAEIQGMLNMRQERNVPIWLGETGENSNVWFTNAIELLEDNGIGWSWWPLKKLGGNNPLQIAMNDDYQQILDYWNGSGTKPSEEVAFKGLMQLAEDLKLEHTTYHPDVVDAMIRQPHTTETRPFKNHVLTAGEEVIVSTTDYDLGRVGHAYQDEEYTNITRDPGGQAWNLGYSYRNDGVDIEPTTDNDPKGNGYSVGWTNAGEWMLYTLKVDSSAAYDLSIRYAGGGSIHFEVDGVDVTENVQLPATGAYDAWDTFLIKDVLLEAGMRKLKLVIDQGGMNLNYFGFQMKSQIDDARFKGLSVTTADESELLLTLNKSLDEGTVSAEGFAVEINGSTQEPKSVALHAVSQLLITTSQGLTSEQKITLVYEGNGLRSTDGILLEPFELRVDNQLPKYLMIPGKIEAENFHVNQGLEIESTTDVGGGQNIGYTNTGDYLDYLINVQESGAYQVEVRVACAGNDGVIRLLQLDEAGETLNSKRVNVPITGGWQAWKTVTVSMDLTAGRTLLRMEIIDPEFNVNWMRFSYLGVLDAKKASGSVIFPNPCTDSFEVKGYEQALRILDLSGKVVQVAQGPVVDMRLLNPGVYLVEMQQSGMTKVEKIVLR